MYNDSHFSIQTILSSTSSPLSVENRLLVEWLSPALQFPLTKQSYKSITLLKYTTDLKVLNLSGSASGKPCIAPPSCVIPQQPTLQNLCLIWRTSYYNTAGIQKPDSSVFQMVDFVLFSNGVVVQTIWKPDIFILDRFFYNYMQNSIGLLPFWNPTIWNLSHSKTDLQNVRFLNDSDFWMVGFQISLYKT